MCNVRRVVLPTLLLSLAAAIELPRPAAADDDNIAASVMQVGVRRASGRMAIGSAVVIAPGLLVTACHGTRGAQSIVLMHGGNELSVNVQREDVERDLCLLSAPSVRGPVAALGDSHQLQVGEQVFAVGFSNGLRVRPSAGDVKSLYGYDGARVIRTSAAFTTGASGGGLFDRQGRLVGILSFKSTAGEDHHYAMPVAWLTRLQSSPANAGTPASEAFWERAEHLQPVFLRAAWLEGTQAWAELAELAALWTQAEPSEIEAWLALARAQSNLRQWNPAREALDRAESLNAQNAEVQALRSDSASWETGGASTQTARDESASPPR